MNKIINIFLALYLTIAIASLTIALILEFDAKLIAKQKYRDYLEHNKFMLYIFIAYQAILMIIFSVLLYLNRRNNYLKELVSLLVISITLFVINIIFFVFELYNARGDFDFVDDYMLLFLTLSTFLYFVFVLYGFVNS